MLEEEQLGERVAEVELGGHELDYYGAAERLVLSFLVPDEELVGDLEEGELLDKLLLRLVEWLILHVQRLLEERGFFEVI